MVDPATEGIDSPDGVWRMFVPAIDGRNPHLPKIGFLESASEVFCEVLGRLFYQLLAVLRSIFSTHSDSTMRLPISQYVAVMTAFMVCAEVARAACNRSTMPFRMSA
jgi:hypothetical protein